MNVAMTITFNRKKIPGIPNGPKATYKRQED